MNPWLAKAVVLIATVLLIAIRAPHGQRSRSVQIVKSQRPLSERILLPIAFLGFFIPLAWVASPVFTFAEYELLPLPFGIGILCYALGLWLFHRSHADLGTNWSVTLDVRKNHTLVTRGSYQRVRHPMYSALFLYSAGQALVIPNWFVGPSYLVTIAALVALRLPREEALMVEQFGDQYSEYAKRTKRLVPGVW